MKKGYAVNERRKSNVFNATAANDERLGSHKTRELAHFSQFPHSHIQPFNYSTWVLTLTDRIFGTFLIDFCTQTHTPNYAGIRMVCSVKGTSCVVSSKSKKAKVIVPNSQKESVNVVVVLWLGLVRCFARSLFVHWIALQDSFLSCLTVEHVDKSRRKGEMRKNVSWSIEEGDFENDLFSDTSSVVYLIYYTIFYRREVCFAKILKVSFHYFTLVFLYGTSLQFNF